MAQSVIKDKILGGVTQTEPGGSAPGKMSDGVRCIPKSVEGSKGCNKKGFTVR